MRAACHPRGTRGRGQKVPRREARHVRQEISLTRPRLLSLTPLSWAGHFAVSLGPENEVPPSQDGFRSRPGVSQRKGHSGSPLDVESSLVHSASGSPLGSCVPQRKASSWPLPLAFLCSVQRLRACLESGRCFSF